ncbi:MAG TPA: hypothetical protein VHM91_09710 [Verrucomicrobiales bacterium]|jgi:hypothetical protein|nr:hypothetical protein [Verrucomicrobiales bacterium]
MTTPKASAGWTVSTAASTRLQLPQFELKQISPHGAVFSSARAYEPGTSFAFGIHLPAAGRNRLMDLEAIVVDCHATGGGAELGWEVTLIFESVTPAQISALRAASRNFPAEPFPLSESFFTGHYGFREPGLN